MEEWMVISDLQVHDVRFPTSIESDGSDAVHPDPDYSAAYVVITTNSGHQGFGMAFTLGRGNEIVCHCIDSLRYIVIGASIQEIFSDMGAWLYKINNEGQMRWLGPEKGVIGMAVAGIVNSLWDLRGRMEGKPVWKILADMEPQEIVKLIDFTYIEDCITKDEALAILEAGANKRKEREECLRKEGLPAYTTAVGWLGYSDEKIRTLSAKFLSEGFTAFKIKVGSNIDDDVRRCGIVREAIGPNCKLMVDANQKWGVDLAINWMKKLKDFNIYWIEEPTSADDILGHKKISEAVGKNGIGVATGEACQNRIMFKQFLMSGGMQFCQIDSARMSGLNEVLSVYLMAAKLGVPVCPHAGGVGLCEMVPHLQAFDYICVTGTHESRLVEWVDHLHQHYEDPAEVNNARYKLPDKPGYSTKLLDESFKDHVYPTGLVWNALMVSGAYKDPSLEKKILPMVHTKE